MKNIIKLLAILVSALVILAACNDDSEETPEQNDEANSQNQSEETTEPDANEEDEESSNSNEEATDNNATEDEHSENEAGSTNGETLSLGETGIMESTLGTYEVTPTSVRIMEEADGEVPTNGVFVVVDLKIKNIGDEELEGADVGKAVLFNSDEIRMPSLNHYEFAEHFTGPISSGEEMTGELVFNHTASDTYELVFGYALSSVSNELTWKFNAEEAE